MEDLISQYVDRTGIEGDTQFILTHLNAVQKELNRLNQSKVNLDSAKTFRQAAESAGELRTSVTGLVDAQGRLLFSTNAIAVGTEKITAGSAKQKDALSQLNAEYKAALRNATNLALEYGAQSEQALEAAAAAQKLKDRLTEASNAAKGKTTTNTVHYEDNFDELNAEHARTVKATGTAVSDLDRIEADAAQSANEWAQAQLNAGHAAGETAENINTLAGAFENATTPLQNYTGTLAENISKSQAYKDRLKEITQEIKDLSTDSPNYTTKLSALTQEQAQLKGAAGELNSVIGQQVKYLQSAEGSTDQLSAKLFLMRDVFRSLSDNEKSSGFGKQLQQDIQAVYNAVKADNESIGNFHDSVGNYVGSLSPLFEKVTNELQKLKAEQKGLQDLSQRNPIGFSIGNQDRLNQVTASIEELERVQQTGFKTTGTYSQQINNLEKSFGDLAKTGTQSEKFLSDFERTLQQTKGSFNASGSTFAGAFKVLENELGTVRQKLNDPALSGAPLKALQAEERLLTQLTENLSQVFGSTRQELRSYIEASVQLATTLGEDNEAVLAFQSQVGKAVNTVQDLKKTIQFQAQDSRFITGSITAVNGLVGAYGAAQGAAELFGDENQDLQRTMIKFQALLTIVNGLQAAANVLQTENGAIQLLLAARIGLVNAAKAVEARLFAATAVAAQAEAVAMSETVVAAEAAAVAQVENMAATEAATAVMVEETVATEAATVATTNFKTALLASGIGALILAIAATVVYLAKKTYDWATSNNAALDTLNKLNDAIKDENALLVEQANLFVSAQSGFKNNLQAQLNASQAAGQNQLKQFAIRKQIAAEEKALAQAGVDALGISRQQETLMLNSIEKLQATKQQFLDDLRTAQAADNDNAAEAAQKNIDGTQKKLDSIKPLYDAVIGARQRLTAATQAQGLLEIEQEKFQADEQRKLILETARIRTEATKAANDAILNSERSTQVERMDAIRSSAAAEKELIEAGRRDVATNPFSTPNDIKIANRNAAEEVKKINRQRNLDILTVNNDYRLRNLQADADAAQKTIELYANLDKEIASNQVFSFAQRLTAQKEYFAAQKKILDNNYRQQLVSAGLNDNEVKQFIKNGELETAYEKDHAAELTAIRTGYEVGILNLAKDNSKAILDITKSDLQKQQALFDEHLGNLKDSFSTADLHLEVSFADDFAALSQMFQAGKISYQKYLKEKKELDRQYQKDSATAALDALQAQLDTYDDTEEQTAAAYAKLLALRQELSLATDKIQQAELEKKIQLAELDYQIEKALNDKKIALAKELAKKRRENAEGDAGNHEDETKTEREKFVEILEYAEKFTHKIAALNDTLAERRISRINQEEEALDTQHERETEIIEQSTANADERNKKKAESDARYAARKFQLDQRERQESQRKAVADKAAAIFEILINTAVAVMKAGGITPQGIATAALGAFELATAIAAPLPKYFKGKNVNDVKTADDRYQGPAVVGDGGRSELIIRDDGRMEVTPAQSTITYLKSKDIVLPDAKKALAQMNQVTNNMDNRVSCVSHTATVRTYHAAQRYEATRSSDVHFKKFNDTLHRGFQSLEETIRNKRENHFYFPDRGKQWVHEGKSWQEILNK